MMATKVVVRTKSKAGGLLAEQVEVVLLIDQVVAMLLMVQALLPQWHSVADVNVLLMPPRALLKMLLIF